MRGAEITLPNLFRAASNSGFGFRSRKPKVFFIGFNKCGTTSFDRFMHSQGLKSIHWRTGERYLALDAAKATDDASAKRIFANGQVFSDFVYLSDTEFCEPLDLYPIWSRAFPSAYFILNDRDVDDWLASRMAHSKGTLMTRYRKVFGLTESETLDAWRHKFLKHRKDVLRHFDGHPRFAHFVLGRDPIETITQLLAPDYRLDPSYFRRRNETGTQA